MNEQNFKCDGENFIPIKGEYLHLEIEIEIHTPSLDSKSEG